MRSPTLQRSVHAAHVLGLAIITLLASGVIPVWAQGSKPQPTLGRHFIVLIDDSCSIGGCEEGSPDRRETIAKELPDRLYGGSNGLPAINPEKDRISVLYFTILGEPSQCGDPRKAKSAAPNNIFKLLYSDKIKSKKIFSELLQEWMSDECYFKGRWSPIVMSSMLVLPYLQSTPDLLKDELYSQTFLVQVTDGLFNTRTTSGHELTEYYGRSITDVDTTDDLLGKVNNLFSLKIFPNQKSERGVFYLGAEYTSQRVPESVVQYQRNSLLYPHAISSSELSYRLNDQLLGDIQLLSQGSGAAYDFKPLWLRVGFQDQNGGDWRIGQETLPRWGEAAKTVSLNPCQLPHCQPDENNDRLGLRLFEAALERPLRVSTTDADPGPGQIKFSVGFHYENDIYDHLCVETPETVINVNPARPTEIQGLLGTSSGLNKSDVADEWKSDDDGVTTQEEARNRLLARRNMSWLLRFLALAALGIFATIIAALVLVRRYYKREFVPKLHWLKAPEVVVDLNRPATSRMLVGRLHIENDQPMPWLGRLLGNKEQPTRDAEISLSYDYFSKSDLEIVGDHPIGFMRGAETNGNGGALNLTTLETVSNGRQVDVFVALETIKDYHAGNALVADPTIEDARFTVPGQSLMVWTNQKTAARKTTDIECRLIVKPEEPRKPLVTFIPAKDPELYFKKGALVQVGSFWFESKATHEFAQPYRWQGYTIQTCQGNRPLSGEPIRLADPEVVVPPGARVEVPVYIDCDNETIPNPDSSSIDYSFKLLGDYSAESEIGPYTTTLYRDPSRAEVLLRLMKKPGTDAEPWLEIYWTPSGELKLRTLPDGTETDEFLDGKVIRLRPEPIKFGPNTSGKHALLSLEIGNSCDVGDGEIKVEIKANIKCDPRVERSIKMFEERPVGDLIGVYDFREPEPNVTIKAGEQAQRRVVYLLPAKISEIVSARIEPGHLEAEVDLEVHINDGQGSKTKRPFKVIAPFSLEQLPGIDWLAIDFGTSSITAARGYGRENANMIALQRVTVAGGRSLADHDLENAEKGNDNLLPSWICCNSDLRDKSGDSTRRGFPGYYAENLSNTPGYSDYIGLPAVTHEFEEYPGRIIYSLKSWLGTASPNIAIQIKKNGQETRELLPLEEMVKSGFSALMDAYLFNYYADRVVITYPNTFTQRHQDLLRRIAFQALGTTDYRRNSIPLLDRIELISESDAVAYHYCMEQRQAAPGKERVLVYDFGAGTLDLSLIEVVWNDGPSRYPTKWTVEKQLGVPIAGNYIDELLARLIHEFLSEPEIVAEQGYVYRLPIVCRVHEVEDLTQHRRGIIRLWKWIRDAKHEWSNKCREVLRQGGSPKEYPAFKVQVGAFNQFQVVMNVGGQPAHTAEPIDEPGLFTKENIYLSIPARLILADKRMTNFMNFVTDEVISELLEGANVKAGDVDTVIISGRGARYADLREKVSQRFPHANIPTLKDEEMKSAVVLGAIARQSLRKRFEYKNKQVAQLAVLHNEGADLVFEKDWRTPIDMTNSPTFRLVQVNLKNPNPREDKKSFRKYFYVDLTDQDLSSEEILGEDKFLNIDRDEKNGELNFIVWGEHGHPQSFFGHGQSGKNVTTPPWPVGNVLLDPEE